MLTDSLTIPARNTIQTMYGISIQPLIVDGEAKQRNVVLRVCDTYNPKRRKDERVAQVAEWTGTRWDGYYLTDPAVIDELIFTRAIVPTDSGDLSIFRLSEYAMLELSEDKARAIKS